MIEDHFESTAIRKVALSEIVSKVKEMTKNANYYVNKDIEDGLVEALKKEESETGINIINQLLENATIAGSKKVPICQDTGMAVFFVEVGQDVHIVNDLKTNPNIHLGTLTEGINEGVRCGYQEGYLRKSIVEDPFHRVNTGDNTPAVIHYDIVEGDKIKVHFAPKGFGSENMSRIYMIKPSDGIEGAKKVILETIEAAGPNACPPMIVGVGIGGSFEKAAILAKKSLLRPINQRSEIEYVRELEEELIKKANNLGIGPQGMGGRTTVLGVNVITHPTHIAGLPVAINISCHATRHAEAII
jgi:fumarate hydratase subunit alpha